MRVTVFDSGAGGIPVLLRLRANFSAVDFAYVSDPEHLPYGDKSSQRIAELTRAALDRAGWGDLVVLACNTATAAAAEELRKIANVPVFGIEPAVKPALVGATEPITVLCTPLTARLRRWADPRVETIADGTLAARAEEALGNPDALERIAASLSPLCRHRVVLGCTHYGYFADGLEKRGHVLFDGTDGLVRNVSRAMRNEGTGTLTFFGRDYGAFIDKAAGRAVY